ncbi:MAG: class I SAM-dependent methyltransferase [Acetobacteraceae bacterium]
MTTPIADAATLQAALTAAAGGAVIDLAPVTFELTEPLRIRCAVTLRGPADAWPLLRFKTPAAELAVAADQVDLVNLALTADGHRDRPLLSISDASRITIAGLALLHGADRGIAIERSSALLLSDVVAFELGASAIEVTDCEGVVITADCRGIGRRQRAPAVVLARTHGFRIDLHVDDVSGNAVTITAPQSGRPGGRIALRANRCFRTLALLGGQAVPLTNVSASVSGSGFVDCAALLSNTEGCAVEIDVADPTDRCVVKLDGGYGARDCRLHVQHANPENVRFDQRGGSRENRCMVVTRDASAVADESPALPPPVANLIAALAERTFSPFEVPGTCSLCGWTGRFRRTLRAVRETMACGACGATLRYRGQAEALLEIIGEARYETLAELVADGGLAGLSVFEPGTVGPLRAFLRHAGSYVHSTYAQGAPSGTVRNGVVCQDLMGTSFADDTFDLVVTSDIFEHIRHPFLAFREIHRILKPGGWHVFTVPFAWPVPEQTRFRVDTSGEEDRHLLPPVYHGSASDGLALVYTDFGRDLGDRLADIGMYSRSFKHRAEPERGEVAMTIAARKIS